MKAVKRMMAMLSAIKPHLGPSMSPDARRIVVAVLDSLHDELAATMPATEPKPKTKLRLVR